MRRWLPIEPLGHGLGKSSKEVTISKRRIFTWLWRSINALLLAALVSAAYCGWRECYVRWYLDGFSDAIVPSVLPAEPKVEAILAWMRAEPSRAVASDPDALDPRDPYKTLNYKQLLNVCGTATNAFLNLSREDNLQVRRLLLLTPDGNTKHVAAEVLIDGRWIVVDPTYRIIMRDNSGRMLTRTDLQRSELLAQATRGIPDYPAIFTYDRVAHIRLQRLPLRGFGLGRLLDTVYPSWDEALDWSLVLERQSFFYLVMACATVIFLVLVRTLLGWYADRRLRIARFHLRAQAARAGAALLTTPDIK